MRQRASRQTGTFSLNIDVQGAEAFRKAALEDPEIAGRLLTVFIQPRDLDQIAERLRARGSESEESISRRLETAKRGRSRNRPDLTTLSPPARAKRTFTAYWPSTARPRRASPIRVKARRLDELLASCGYTSRREVKKLDTGRTASLCAAKSPPPHPSRRTPPKFSSMAKAVDHPATLLLLMHKARRLRFVRTMTAKAPGVYDLLPPRWQARNPSLNTVGRLDKDTTGALLLTDDGTLVHAWTHPKRKVEKHYLVDLARPLDADLVPRFAAGDLLVGGRGRALSSGPP